MSQTPNLEICIDAVDSAVAAERGGAQRVELCSDLPEGGVTPSAGLIATVRSRTSLGLHVIIRPRGGDFIYSDDEFEVMKQDVASAKLHGADGVVIGLLNVDGSIDVPRSKQLVALARPLSVTFHRAFDVVPDLMKGLEDVISTGADRLLTSGGEPSALKGIASLAALVKAAAGRIIILGAGGVNASNAKEVVERTGLSEVHAGLRRIISGRMQQSSKNISPGIAGMDESQRFVVLEEDVRKLSDVLKTVTRSS